MNHELYREAARRAQHNLDVILICCQGPTTVQVDLAYKAYYAALDLAGKQQAIINIQQALKGDYHGGRTDKQTDL